MSGLRRTSALTLLAFAIVGVGAGLLVQSARSARGHGPFVPPLSLPLTLLVMGGVLVVLGVLLRRAVSQSSKRAVNPFHAVRLLAGAKSAQFLGALLGAFGGGLALQLLSRSVLPAATVWVPMVLVLGAGIVLVICGIITESLCKVPPTDQTDQQHLPNTPEPSAP